MSPEPRSPGEAMTPDEFRRWGHEAVEWVARYLEVVEDLPVLSTLEPGEVRAGLPPPPPRWPEPFGDILADLDTAILPGITHWQHPRFFGYFPSNAALAASSR